MKIELKVVDELGALKAQIAELTAQAKMIEAGLKAAGPGRIEGVLYDANVFTQERTLVDWKAVAEKLQPSRQLVTAHTSTVEVIVIKVTARKGA
ncbi:MAG: hypothetical protein FJ091_22210 [Deltaproteobacteria bacterium]|nr:hypothetical protein [Deltaproteobacteria bacterium]